MRKPSARFRVVAALLVTAAFLTVSFVPQIVVSYLPQVEYTSLTAMPYSYSVVCTGEIVAPNSRELYLNSPVITSEVYVSVGDYVNKGDPLFRVEKELTRSVLSRQDVPVSGDNLTDTDYAALYGLFGGSDIAVSGEYDSYVKKNNYMLDYMPETICAPVSGVITDLGVSPDVMHSSVSPLAVITDTSFYYARVSINESYASEIEVGARVKITGSAFSESYAGEVVKIYPTARKRISGTSQETVIDLDIAISEPGESLKPGYSANARIYLTDETTLPVLPYSCVRQDEKNNEYVYVLRGSTAVRVNVVTGVEFTDAVQIVHTVLII